MKIGNYSITEENGKLKFQENGKQTWKTLGKYLEEDQIRLSKIKCRCGRFGLTRLINSFSPYIVCAGPRGSRCDYYTLKVN
jgi:hypothetical protein